MAHSTQASVHGITADDEVRHEHYNQGSISHHWMELPGGITLFFDGFGDECEANLVGFLDQMHAIRNAVLQDKADRVEAGS